MNFAVKNIAAVVFFTAVAVPASAGTVPAGALAQAGFSTFASMDIKIPAVSPAVPAAGKSAPVRSILPRDVFTEVKSCSIVDALFIMQPTIQDALKMLEPCLAGISEQNLNIPVSVKAIYKNNEVEKIIISVAEPRREYVTQLIRTSVTKRDNHLFGYPAEVVRQFAQ